METPSRPPARPWAATLSSRPALTSSSLRPRCRCRPFFSLLRRLAAAVIYTRRHVTSRWRTLRTVLLSLRLDAAGSRKRPGRPESPEDPWKASVTRRGSWGEGRLEEENRAFPLLFTSDHRRKKHSLPEPKACSYL